MKEYELSKIIFDKAPISLIILDENAVVCNVNKTALQLVNKTKEEIVGKHFGNSLNCFESTLDERGCGYGTMCSDCQIIKAIDLAIQNSQSTNNIEIRKELIKDENKSEFWFKVNIEPIEIDGRMN